MVFGKFKNYYILRYIIYDFLKKVSGGNRPTCLAKILCALLFRAGFKWRLQENRFFLVFGLIIHFMATTTKAKRCIFISRTPKCPGYRSILNKSRRYRLFSALLRSQFGPIWILWGHGWWKLCCKTLHFTAQHYTFEEDL